MARNPRNLVLNKGTWHVRVDIPTEVQKVFGKKTFRKSTGTGNRQEAIDRSHPIIHLFKGQIRTARIANQHDWRQEAAEGFVEIKQQRDQLYDSIGKASLTNKFVLQPEYFVAYRDAIEELIRELIERNNLTLAAFVKEKYLKLIHVLECGFPNPDQDEVLAAYVALTRAREDVLQYDLAYENELNSDELRELSAIQLSPSKHLNQAPISNASIEVYKKYAATQIDSEKTIEEYVSKIHRFSDHLSKFTAQINFDNVAVFIKSTSTKAKTQSKYLSALRSYWDWAMKYHEPIRSIWVSKASPFEGHVLPKTKVARKAPYVYFTEDEQRLLLSEALKASDLTLALAICYGIFTGCRLEEIGRLQSEHTVYESGIPVAFAVSEAKTEAGIRTVPIHRDLIKIHVQIVASKVGYVFKGGSNKYGNRFDYISKRFGTLKNRLGFPSDRVFHSFRKSFITAMHRTGQGDGITPYLVGHEPTSFTWSVYSEGPSAAQLIEAVDRLNFDFISCEVASLLARLQQESLT